ncbi:MAG: glutamate--tRNA ligase [Rhodospirillales bacterium]|jgi:glutamyl-tRNA synthetase|nr:glutamate--tRNA ligase [Rhodospirillales bacterium]HIJ42468.1 glutamate--tRNA ligase [Rhodospirillaceae bacterium]MDP7216091.1 glutamate--tRNA ligase [Rhodospirillales bacterium]HIJ44678.1 glutamate--tRNA ligase [Rhodospirillaceae bacterium]HIJ91821.1 glutamate--tRNA ligase [Rhodospirillaceae bacterium]
MTVVTRFAPSPTGFLHLGGARTALFNWLFARHHGGKFLLRIEDTDRARSTDRAVEAIHDGLHWLGLDWDGEAVSQFSRRHRHVAAAGRLLDEDKAYRCFCTTDELAEIRETARRQGRPPRYDGRCRDRDRAETPEGGDPVIRFKAPQSGKTTIRDMVQGEVEVANEELDDMVLLRADGTPTYMLAVVVDDHEMGITHVIRGDDHLTNAFRQIQIFQALGWPPPEFAHIPLIHGADGAKLSKRHGALGIEAYREMGFLTESMRNYLLRLGWGHGDDEIISTEDAIRWFDMGGVGRSPSRFDIAKLTNLNGHYLRNADDRRLTSLILPGLAEKLGGKLAEEASNRLLKGMSGLKHRAKTIVELIDNSEFYVKSRPLPMNDKAAKFVHGNGKEVLHGMRRELAALGGWTAEALEEAARHFAETAEIKLGAVAQPLRAALTGATISPSVFEIMAVLGRQETLGRLDDVLTR